MMAKDNTDIQIPQDHVLNLSQHKIETPFPIVKTIGEFRRVVNHNTHGPQYIEALAMVLNYATAIEKKVIEKNMSLQRTICTERRNNNKTIQDLTNTQ